MNPSRNRFLCALAWIGIGFVNAALVLLFGPSGAAKFEDDTAARLCGGLPHDDQHAFRHWRN